MHWLLNERGALRKRKRDSVLFRVSLVPSGVLVVPLFGNLGKFIWKSCFEINQHHKTRPSLTIENNRWVCESYHPMHTSLSSSSPPHLPPLSLSHIHIGIPTTYMFLCLWYNNNFFVMFMYKLIYSFSCPWMLVSICLHIHMIMNDGLEWMLLELDHNPIGETYKSSYIVSDCYLLVLCLERLNLLIISLFNSLNLTTLPALYLHKSKIYL